MLEKLPVIYIATHGETAWSLTGQHCGLTDLPLSEQGEADAKSLKRRLHGMLFAAVFTSSLQRAYRTCELAGFSNIAEIDSDLAEWDYGRYEGLLDEDIWRDRPGWFLFRDGCPVGESPEQVTVRADRVIARVRSIHDDVLLFSSIDFTRALAVRWIGLGLANNARRFVLSPGSLSAVGYENTVARPVIRLWNDTRHILRAAVQRVGSEHD